MHVLFMLRTLSDSCMYFDELFLFLYFNKTTISSPEEYYLVKDTKRVGEQTLYLFENKIRQEEYRSYPTTKFGK